MSVTRTLQSSRSTAGTTSHAWHDFGAGSMLPRPRPLLICGDLQGGNPWHDVSICLNCSQRHQPTCQNMPALLPHNPFGDALCTLAWDRACHGPDDAVLHAAHPVIDCMTSGRCPQHHLVDCRQVGRVLSADGRRGWWFVDLQHACTVADTRGKAATRNECCSSLH